MSQKITIDPVTRIEGHAKITIHLDETGQVEDARFHVTEFRGFEKFCEGRPLWEMPGITGRICGICPVSHLLASAKAGDRILAVDIPPAAEKLRRLMNLGQIIQSHALSFFHLSAPDLLLGMDSNPTSRNVFGLIAAEPELARGGIRLRQFGQEIIELLGGKKIHPAWAVPGGVRSCLSEEGKQQIGDCEASRRHRIPEVKTTVHDALDKFKSLLDRYQIEAQTFGNFPSLFMGLVGQDGEWEHYGGKIRFVDSAGNIIADRLEPTNYRDFIAEAVEPWSFLKFPYYRPLGYPAKENTCSLQSGIYRVGPLARLNICSHIGTPLGDRELREFRDRGQGIVNSSFFYHYARLIEILACIERIEKMLEDTDLYSDRLIQDVQKAIVPPVCSIDKNESGKIAKTKATQKLEQSDRTFMKCFVGAASYVAYRVFMLRLEIIKHKLKQELESLFSSKFKTSEAKFKEIRKARRKNCYFYHGVEITPRSALNCCGDELIRLKPGTKVKILTDYHSSSLSDDNRQIMIYVTPIEIIIHT
ncbi:MAG: Ni/Fe hydrogenase subunit alpha [Cyanobacteria bacterium P01_A01_bin.83]